MAYEPDLSMAAELAEKEALIDKQDAEIKRLRAALGLLEMCDLSNEENPTRKVRQIAERALRGEGEE